MQEKEREQVMESKVKQLSKEGKMVALHLGKEVKTLKSKTEDAQKISQKAIENASTSKTTIVHADFPYLSYCRAWTSYYCNICCNRRHNPCGHHHSHWSCVSYE